MGSWISAVLLDWLGGEDAETAADLLLGAGLAGAVPTVATGYADWADTEPGNDPVRRIGMVHAAFNGAAAVLFAASLAARATGSRGRGKLLALAGLSSVGVGGYLGGHLTYAEGVGVAMTTFEDYPEDWTQALADAALGEGEMKAVDVGGVSILIARRGGNVYALSDTCVHRGGSLADGELTGDCVECPLHASGFRLADGSVEQGPAAYPQPAPRGAGARRLDRGPGAAAPVSEYALARFTEQATRESHGGDQDGRRARRRADGARDRPGRRAGGLRRRAARGRRRRARQGRRQDREAARPRGREGQARRRRTPTPSRGRIHGTTDYGDLADCDLVIEAITEDLGLKLEMWRELDAIVKPEAVFATNTSSLAVIDQAAATSRPDRFVGLHFFNPAQVMKLVEVIRAVTTSDEAFQAGLEFGASSASKTVQTQRQGRLHRQPPARAVHARRDPRLRGGRRLDRRRSTRR